MLASRDVAALRERVLAWYAATARPLAFRGTSDPWAILVSEVMAQQTQAARAAEAWTRFMAAYPTPAALAAASPADVLRAWRGLGYNRRAIALQRAARAIVDEHAGRVPDELAALERLPGIGPYSARAVAALAFGRRVGAVDTNVRRVLARAILGATDPADADRRAIQSVADALAPAAAPGTWTHALMDVGATICRAGRPRCEGCPLRPWCRAAEHFEQPNARPQQAPGHRAEATPRQRFHATSRWLRGRILDRLRDAQPGSWLRFEQAIGRHDLGAIDCALRAMAGEGLLELRAGPAELDTSATCLEARLPVA